jgi:hypothetical protein
MCNMITKQQIRQYAKQIKNIDKQTTGLFNDIQNLKGERDKLLVEYIFQNKLLSTVSWELTNGCLNASEVTDKFKEIYTLSGETWGRLRINLSKSIELVINLDDMGVYLQFDEDQIDIDWIKNNNLTITTKGAQEELDILYKKIENYTKIINMGLTASQG